MNNDINSSASADPSLARPRRASLAIAVGAVVGLLAGASVGLAFGGVSGAVVGAVLGALIGALLGRMFVRTDAPAASRVGMQAAVERPAGAGESGWSAPAASSHREPDVSLARRSGEAASSTSVNPGWNKADQSGAVNVRLAEERLEVDKRELEAGLVRVRKVVRTEVVQVPVELRREEIVVERVEPGAETASGEAAASEPIEHSSGDDLVVRLVREEPVIQKESKVFSEVRIHKVIHTESQNVSGTVRREEVVVDQPKAD